MRAKCGPIKRQSGPVKQRHFSCSSGHHTIKRLDTNKPKERAVIAQSALAAVPLSQSAVWPIFCRRSTCSCCQLDFVRLALLAPASTARAPPPNGYTPDGAQPTQKMIFHLALCVQQPNVSIRRALNN